MNYRNDVFNEQLVTRKNNSKILFQKVGIVVAAVLIAIIAGFIPLVQQFWVFIVAVLVVVAIYLIRRMNVEFEYAFTNGELDIDKIFNKSKRKRMLSVEVSEFHVMVKADSERRKSEVGNVQETLDFSSGIDNENTYIAVLDYKGKRTQLIFEPNEKVYNAIRMYIPKKIRN